MLLSADGTIATMVPNASATATALAVEMIALQHALAVEALALQTLDVAVNAEVVLAEVALGVPARRRKSWIKRCKTTSKMGRRLRALVKARLPMASVRVATLRTTMEWSLRYTKSKAGCIIKTL
jgi:hypothetical protein